MPSGLRAAASEEKRNGGRGVEIRGVPPYSYSSMGSISVTSAQFQLAHCGQCQFICNSRGQVARLKFAFHSILFRQRFCPGLAWLQVCTLCAALLRLPDDDIANTSADLKSQFELKAKLNRARSQLRLKAASMHN